MTITTFGRPFGQLIRDEELGELPAEVARKSSGTFLGFGFALIVLGVIACANFFGATIVSMYALSGFLLVGGFLHAGNAFSERKWTSALLDTIVAIFYIVAGLLTASRPVAAAAGVALMLSAFFMVSGIMRAITALSAKPVQWGWMLVSGVASFILGILLYQGWPTTSLWFIGFIIGVDLIFGGISLTSIGFALRRATKQRDKRLEQSTHVPGTI